MFLKKTYCSNLPIRIPYPRHTQGREGAKAEITAPAVPSNEDTLIIFADPNRSTNKPFTRAKITCRDSLNR